MPDQKLDNLLNLAMDATPQERAKSENLNVGYDSTTRLWDVIVKYSGPESGLGGERIQVVPLLGGYAVVTLPEDIKDKELLNEVTVTTQETGDQTVSSQAKVQIRQAEEKKEDSVDTDNEETLNAGESYPASSHPKTGDPYQPFLWLAMIPGSLLAAGWIRSKM